MKRRVIYAATAFVLVGCTLPGGAKFSSEHGYCVQGKFSQDTFVGSGCPTIVPDGASPMGSRATNSDGVVTEDMFSTITGADGSSATGPAALIVAETHRLTQLLMICAVAPESNACKGG